MERVIDGRRLKQFTPSPFHVGRMLKWMQAKQRDYPGYWARFSYSRKGWYAYREHTGDVTYWK